MFLSQMDFVQCFQENFEDIKLFIWYYIQCSQQRFGSLSISFFAEQISFYQKRYNGWTIKVVTSAIPQETSHGVYLEKQHKRLESPVFNVISGQGQKKQLKHSTQKTLDLLLNFWSFQGLNWKKSMMLFSCACLLRSVL